MNIFDYILDHQRIDWGSVSQPWQELLPKDFRVWLMNRFGDLILITDDEAVHFFDVGNGSIERVAENKEQFMERIDQEDNADNWLMISLIDQLVSAGKILQDGYCYSYLTLPVFGGEYSVNNTTMLPIAEHYGVCASIHEQIKGLPDGTKVVIEVINSPSADKPG